MNVKAMLEQVYFHGWCNAAKWANRTDLISDEGSRAYADARKPHVDAAIAALEAGRSADWVLVPREADPELMQAVLGHGIGHKPLPELVKKAQARWAHILEVAAAPQQPPPVGVTDAMRIEWLDSQVRQYGDGHTEPLEASLTVEWQQSAPGERWLGLRAWVDAEIAQLDTDDRSDLEAAIQQEAAPSVSDHVRRQVGRLAQWSMCMSHSESYFGEPAGLVKSVTEELTHAVDPIYPPIVPPPDPLAGVTIYTARGKL